MKGVAEICSDLIRFDTSNPGSGERPAAEYVATLLADAGIVPEVFESAPGRTTVVARMEGDSSDALLIHGHLDVVPADPAEWQLHPFSGEITDGCVYGRGAVDMKGSCAMTLATVLELKARGVRPKRDLVLAFLADEEATGEYGSRYAVTEHRDLFDGVTEAISESGGFSVQSGGVRVYPVAVGERGTAWMKVTAHGVAGHGSKPPVDNPVASLAHALSRLASHTWPVRLTPPVVALLESLSEITGRPVDLQH
ncbi:MAG: M20/M25/M40 family metallo-hydrolase, partial [Nonomuraea sp.]|nr:M20/M25/M40 family metallo-hydrolase [Nonomuraea sp.]